LTQRSASKILWFEPWIFIGFGIFHLHRVWAFLDPGAYAAFWIAFLESRSIAYYLAMLALLAPCLAGIAVFFLNLGRNYRWRWIYLIGGGYLTWDLTAQLFRISAVDSLLHAMFDLASPYWDLVWGFFVLLGAAALVLGIRMEMLRRKQ